MFTWVSAGCFVVGAAAADGHKLFGWPMWTWILLGVAAYVLSGVTLAMPNFRRR